MLRMWCWPIGNVLAVELDLTVTIFAPVLWRFFCDYVRNRTHHPPQFVLAIRSSKFPLHFDVIDFICHLGLAAIYCMKPPGSFRAVPPTVMRSSLVVGMPTPTGTACPSLPHVPMPS